MKFLAGLLTVLANVGLLAVAAHAVTITYSYDSFGRIDQVTYGDGTVVTYTYDTAGNWFASACSGPSC
ncbi:MAG: RHS repeat protein [Rhodospirillales bacterium]|nr:RHS repeat protein [Rhodospirillales bacterium]